MIEGIKRISTLAKLQNRLFEQLCLFDARQNCFLIGRNMHYFARIQIEKSNTWEIKETLLHGEKKTQYATLTTLWSMFILALWLQKKERGSGDWQVWILRVQVCITGNLPSLLQLIYGSLMGLCPRQILSAVNKSSGRWDARLSL